MTIAHLTVHELGDRRVADAITVRGKELQVDDTVADTRALFASSSVHLVPILDGEPTSAPCFATTCPPTRTTLTRSSPTSTVAHPPSRPRRGSRTPSKRLPSTAAGA